MKILGASVAVAGLEGCVEPPASRILPYVHQPPETVPGTPRTFATALVRDGYATGLLVRTREGRPIKVEGNPDHPASLGGAGPIEQAYLLQLYDPSRGREFVAPDGAPAGRERLLREVIEPWSREGGSGLHLLLEPTSSPTRIALLERLRQELPEARVHFHSPTGPSRATEAFQRLTERPLAPRYRFDRARIVVAVDADFVSAMPFHLRYARDFAEWRAPSGPTDAMNRLYLAEPSPTPMAPVADHGLPVRAGDAIFLLGELAGALGVRPGGLPDAPARLRTEEVRAWVEAAAADLRASPGVGAVVVGESQPPAAHGLAHRMNEAIGAVGSTVILRESVLHRASEIPGGLERLSDAARRGEVKSLVILEGNPAYTAPADLGFADVLDEIPRSLYVGLYRNETAQRTGWYAPSRHPLEMWGDGRAYDGTVTPIQPLIRPLYPGLSPDEVLSALLGRPEADPRDLVREAWRSAGFGPASGSEDFEVFWERALVRGLVEGTGSTDAPVGGVTEAPAAGVSSAEGPRAGGSPAVSEAELSALLAEVEPPGDGIELGLRPDPRVHDGSYSNNAWLQELPDPTTKLTWGNAALLSPRTARELGLAQGDAVVLAHAEGELTVPVLPTPGHVDAAVTLTLGYGREGEEAVARGLGVNAYLLRTTRRPWTAEVELVPATDAGTVDLAVSQPEWHLHGRPAVLRMTLPEYRENPDFAEPHRGEVASWYRPPDLRQSEHQWAMTVDLSACTGCGACTVACQAENNVPVVGPEEVRKGRIMHWIRIDRYIVGSEEDPEEHLRQPMLCQHCEKAPCEYVCPVNATVHSADGLNEMVYNRCVGTRFCSNNCPYKVRRFNWFDYNERRSPVEALVLNPDVTVRERGVMEKCTYCVQRIRRAENRALREKRELDPGEVTTACQQTCPTRAITFGDLHADGELARTREDSRAYSVLHELGTMPRTRYLARITNPNEELEARVLALRTGRGAPVAGGRPPVPDGGGSSRGGAPPPERSEA